MTTARDLRASDADRQAAAQRLGAAWAEGRLDDAEYDRRLGLAYAAVTYRDLDSLFPDLAVPQSFPPPPVVPWDRPTSGRGEVRSTGLQMLLFVVTFGIWGYVYFFQTHEEMKRHTGEGIGGVIALLLAFFVWMASPFLLSFEVGRLYARAGRRPPVSALTGLWFFPGIFLLVGPIIWFVLTNGALNDYWRGVRTR
jgi:uncharacterized protein DUF1707/uncharacterized protein DUF4234